MRINTNLSALNAYRNLNMTDSRLNKSLERLSSGLRINRAADDAAGLAISEKMRGQIRGLNQATRNAQDGISLMQTAEGALNETHSILQRMRELAVQAASDTLTSSDRIEIQREIDQLKGEMDRIASSTEFNTKKLLDGTSAALTSTSDLNTKVFMRGGLRTVDQFGQKAVGGGNYKLEIDAIAGKGEVQKTDIMKVKHEKNVIDIDGTSGGLKAVMRYGIDTSEDDFSAGITIELEAGSAGTTLSASLSSSTVTINFDPAEHNVKDIYDALSGLTAGITLADGILSSGATLSFNELFDFQLIDGAMDVETAGGSNENLTEVGWFVGNVASTETEIGDIDRFWDANGNFLAEDPQTINIVQGNGKQTSITIFGSDTIQDIEDKLNRAIHNDLEQREFSSESDAYVKFVSEVAATNDGNFSVGGTFVIQSAVTGKDGELRFSGNEGIINALSLTTLQKSEENEFTVSVYDAHTEEVVAQNERIVGNMLVGVVHENVDVKFDPMAGVMVETDINGDFVWEGSSEEDSNIDTSTIFVHLSDNTMVFHIGANPLQDVGAAIGDMSAEALGVDNILVTNRESANRALSQVDYAIENVSSERAKLGAVQNRLEHTINNLTVAAENLTAAESRVRDLDFAMEMVEFTRNQIMTQAGTSMLAQANQKPQSVLMLLQ